MSAFRISHWRANSVHAKLEFLSASSLYYFKYVIQSLLVERKTRFTLWLWF